MMPSAQDAARCTSSSELIPPEAITGIAIARASAAVSSRFGPAEHSIARDVGVDDCGDSGVFETAREFDRGCLALLEPAFHRTPAVLCVDPNRNLTGKLAACFDDQIGIAQRDRSENGALHTAAECIFNRRQRTQSPTELDGY